MKVFVKGTMFTTMGDFAHFKSRKVLHDALCAADGLVSKSLSLKTQAFILGGSSSGGEDGIRRDVRRLRRIPVLTEDQAIELLEHGEVEVEGFESSRAFDEVVVEARALFDGVLTSDRWLALMALVDESASAQLPEVIRYIEDQLVARTQSTEEYMSWVVPINWLRQVSEGHTSARYSLARTIRFYSGLLSSTEASALLKSDQFKGLSSLNISLESVGLSVLKTLAVSPCAPQLKNLELSELLSKHIKVLDAQAPFDELRSLTLYYSRQRFDAGALQALADTWCAQVTALECVGQDIAHLLNLMLSGEVLFPSLTHMTLSQSYDGLCVSECELLSRVCTVESVKLHYWTELRHDRIDGLCALTFSHAKHIDLSAIELRHNKFHDRGPTPEELAGWRARLLDLLPTSPLLSCIESVRLGPWKSPELTEAIEAEGTRVVG